MYKLDYEKVFWTLVSETKKYLLDNNLKAMILGISGGIDSTVTAAICYEVSKQTSIPLIGRSLPIKNKNDEFNTSKLAGEAFCNDFKVVNLIDSYNIMRETTCDNEDYHDTPISRGNIQARLRMIYLYNLASIHNGLVMSTDNQTEYQLGFWTIHGDIGDFDPLQDLWKTEVYGLASYISTYYRTLSTGDDEYLKKAIAIQHSITLTPTDGLGISNSDLDQIGAKSYAEVDAILQDFLAYNEMFSATSKKVNADRYLEYNALYDIDPKVIKKVLDRHIASEFKRKKAPIYIERRKYEI
jgi:NAD+ synthetase|nr:MAG TPA: hypothetical protein [Bacteriophage sp.]